MAITAIRPTVVAMMVFGLLVPGAAAAQGTFPPAAFQNLQVLPKHASARVVVGAMKSVANNLGVRCQFCRIGEEGLPSRQIKTDESQRAVKRLRPAIQLLGSTEVTARHPSP